MRMLTALAFAATLAVGFAGTFDTAQAQFAAPPRVAPGGSPAATDHGPDLCTAACFSIPPRAKKTAYQVCGDKLAELRPVSAGQVGRVGDPATVHLVPLCDITNHSLSQQEWAYLARGNVSGILPAIAGNPVLMAELGHGGYKANDVIGVLLGSNAAVLYVSHR